MPVACQEEAVTPIPLVLQEPTAQYSETAGEKAKPGYFFLSFTQDPGLLTWKGCAKLSKKTKSCAVRTPMEKEPTPLVSSTEFARQGRTVGGGGAVI